MATDISSVWNKERVLGKRIPDNIYKSSKLGSKCSERDCTFHFTDIRQMTTCKGPSVPIGYSDKIMKKLVGHLANVGYKSALDCAQKG